MTNSNRSGYGFKTPSPPGSSTLDRAQKSCNRMFLALNRGPPITPTYTIDIVLGHTCSYMVRSRLCGHMNASEGALSIVPAEGRHHQAVAHPRAAVSRALTRHTCPARVGAGTMGPACILVDVWSMHTVGIAHRR